MLFTLPGQHFSGRVAGTKAYSNIRLKDLARGKDPVNHPGERAPARPFQALTRVTESRRNPKVAVNKNSAATPSRNSMFSKHDA